MSAPSSAPRVRRASPAVLGRAARVGGGAGAVLGLVVVPVVTLATQLPEIDGGDVGIALTAFGNVVVEALLTVVGAVAGAATGLAAAAAWLVVSGRLGFRAWLCRLVAGLVAATVVLLLAIPAGLTRTDGWPGLAAVLAAVAAVIAVLAVPSVGYRDA